MGLMSFVGRLFFVSIFLFTSWQEFNAFGVDGGPAAKDFRPKYNRLMNHVNHRLGVHVPGIEIKHIVAANIALKGIGGILFVFSSSFGAYLLLLQLTFMTPILFDFYNYDIKNPHFFQLLVKFTQCMALFGALLFFLDMKNAIPLKQSKKKAPKAKTV
eukprot:TRINITY_DN42319_c0_g2_i1.p1 TRINITY_DN42319_c0_g2~~TRINITY_DN42319_c0_g2_i1.p1  ORF type:complete len:166 (-),score=25.45 TRINITY_DN42319_c0_g2_i1:238-711(-)